MVQEKVGDGKWNGGVAVPGSATNYVRTVDQPGKYQYQVAAVRPAPTADSGNGASATKTSNYVAASVVNVPQVAPPTTAAAGPNGPDGSIDHSGDNGVSLPTDPTSSTAPGSHASGKGTLAAGRSGVALGAPRPAGSSSRPAGASAAAGGAAEGEGPGGGDSATPPFQQAQDGATDRLRSGSGNAP